MINQNLQISIINLNDNSPIILTDIDFDVEENQKNIGLIEAVDLDGDDLTYSLGYWSFDEINIDKNGNLTWKDKNTANYWAIKVLWKG